MTHAITPSRTSLISLVAALALLLAAPLGIAALETNPLTGPAMRSLESTSIGQVVGAFSADAEAAISRSRQASKAAGQASFFCYAWQCRSYYRRSASYSGTTLKTTWRLAYPRNMLYHGNCRTYAYMSISVSSTGGVVSRLMSCA